MKFVKKNLFSLIAAVLVVVAVILNLLPFVTYSTSGFGGAVSASSSFNGWVVMFGGEGSGSLGASGIGSLSGNPETKLVVVALISFILMVIGLAATVVNMLLDTKIKKILAFVGMGTLVAAGILLFFTLAGFFGANEINENLGK